MDEVQISRELRDIEQSLIKDKEVITEMAKVTQLELRVKNVATSMLIRNCELRKKANIREKLSTVIKNASKDNRKKRRHLMRKQTVELEDDDDGLLGRMSEKLLDCMERVEK